MKARFVFRIASCLMLVVVVFPLISAPALAATEGASPALADREVTAPAEAAAPSTLLRASPEGEWDRNREAETSARRSGNPSAENGPASSREHASIPLNAILGEVDPSVSQVHATSPHCADGVDAATTVSR